MTAIDPVPTDPVSAGGGRSWRWTPLSGWENIPNLQGTEIGR
jgi:hypothetical protein